MAVQNLISALLPAELKASIIAALTDLKEKCSSFVISLLPEEKKQYLKLGSFMMPAVEIAHNAIQNYPQILSAVFNKTEYEKDYQFSKELTPIAASLDELNDSVQNTLFAVNSDLLSETLEIYAAILQNEDKVPGLSVVADELRAFFKKPKRDKPAPVQ